MPEPCPTTQTSTTTQGTLYLDISLCSAIPPARGSGTDLLQSRLTLLQQFLALVGFHVLVTGRMTWPPYIHSFLLLASFKGLNQMTLQELCVLAGRPQLPQALEREQRQQANDRDDDEEGWFRFTLAVEENVVLRLIMELSSLAKEPNVARANPTTESMKAEATRHEARIAAAFLLLEKLETQLRSEFKYPKGALLNQNQLTLLVDRLVWLFVLGRRINVGVFSSAIWSINPGMSPSLLTSIRIPPTFVTSSQSPATRLSPPAISTIRIFTK